MHFQNFNSILDDLMVVLALFQLPKGLEAGEIVVRWIRCIDGCFDGFHAIEDIICDFRKYIMIGRGKEFVFLKMLEN